MGGILSRLGNASAAARAIVLAALAVPSAVASALSYDTPGSRVWDVPVLPGFYFAAVIAAGVLLWRSRQVAVAAAVFVALTFAWIAAVRSAIHVHEHVMDLLREIARGTSPREPNYLFALCGAVGGLVGSAVTAAALAAVAGEFRAFTAWGRVVMAGTAAGILLECAADGAGAPLPIHLDSLLPLFLVWQMGVAAAIGYGMLPRVKRGEAMAEPGPSA